MDWRHEPIWDPYIQNRILDFLNLVKSPEEITERLKKVSWGKKKEVEFRKELASEILKKRNELPEQKFTILKELDKIHGIDHDELYIIFSSFRDREVETALETDILAFMNAATDELEIVNRIWFDPDWTHIKYKGHHRLYLSYFYGEGKDHLSDEEIADKTGIDTKLADEIIKARSKLEGKKFTALKEIYKIHKMDARHFHNILYSFAKIPLNSPGDLSALIKTDTWIASLPAGFTELTNFTLADIEMTWDAATSSFSNVTFALQSPTPWELTSGDAANPTPILDDVTLYYAIENPGTPEETITAEMKTAHLAGGVEVPLIVPLPADTGDINWSLEQPTMVASLQDVSGLFDTETAALLPEGLLSATGGGVELQALEVSVVDG